MSDVFIYAAELYCADCGQAIRDDMAEKLPSNVPADPDAESSYDSGDYPKGPYPDGGGIADTPQHCGSCRVFLGNPLSREGLKWTAYMVRAAKRLKQTPSVALEQWAPFYAEELARVTESRPVWRIYCYADNTNREFGRDYTRREAMETAAQYRKMYPDNRYRVRKCMAQGFKVRG